MKYCNLQELTDALILKLNIAVYHAWAKIFNIIYCETWEPLSVLTQIVRETLLQKVNFQEDEAAYDCTIRPWSSLVGDDGCIGPSGKLLCL